MELWIKSVNNLILIKPDFIFAEPVEAKKDTAWKIRAKYGINEYTLGYYKDEKRTIEILNEIHQRLINLQTIETAGADYITNQIKKNGIDCVYQMPRE